MGWKDAPLVDSSPAWMSAPVVEDAPKPVAKPSGPSATDNFLSGAGIGLRNFAQGIAQRGNEMMASNPVIPPEVARFIKTRGELATSIDRENDRPVTDTTSGKVGEIAGTAVPAAIAAFLPGGQTLAGSVVGGALFGGAQRTASGESAAKNALWGGAGGAAGYGVGQLIGKGVNALTSSKAASQVANSGRDIAAQEARQAGYTLPTSQTNPTMLNRTLEGLSGKIQTAQHAAVKNQEVTQQLASKAIGLTPEQLSKESVEGVIKQAGQVYKTLKAEAPFVADEAFSSQVAKIGENTRKLAAEFPELGNPQVEKLVENLAGKKSLDASVAVDAIKQLRKDATTLFKAFDDPKKLDLARAYREAADSMEALIERNLQSRGNTALLPEFQAARKLIAKAHTVDAAMKENGVISAAKIAKQLEKGKPLTDELFTIGKTAQSFPKAMQELTGQSTLNISPLDAAAGLISGNPALMVARPAARAVILSKPYQSAMGAAGYSNPLRALASDPAKAAMIAAGQQFRLPQPSQ